MTRFMRVVAIAAAAVLIVTGPSVAESAYTTLDLEECAVLATYEVGAEFECPGYRGLAVFVSDGDARMEADFGVPNEAFESFSAFNGVGDTIEWMLDDNGNPYATALRYLIDVDGRSAEALVVSRIGTANKAGCVVAVVDAATEQANGVARGLGAMAAYFDCRTDQVVIVPGASELVAGFNGANR